MHSLRDYLYTSYMRFLLINSSELYIMVFLEEPQYSSMLFIATLRLYVLFKISVVQLNITPKGIKTYIY